VFFVLFMVMWQRRWVLGKGMYNTMFLAEPTDRTAPLISVKACPIAKSSSLQLEERVLVRLSGCSDIVSCLGSSLTVEDGTRLYNLFLEYVAGGTLADFIKKELGLCERDMRRYMCMILQGLCSLHGKGMVHCDLKPSNILVFPSEEGVLNANWLKIANFGLAKEGKEETRFWGLNFRGTPFYMSSVSIVFGDNGPVLDIWSMGCILVEMVTRKPALCGSIKI
jgi:serine/threonine protein kinase